MPASPAQGGPHYIHHIPGDSFREPIARGRFLPTSDFAELGRADAILICVPTPLTAHRERDLTYVENTARAIAPHLRPGQLVVLEPTTYPGTTRDVVKPILETSGLQSGRDFFIAFSPEREDPGNLNFSTQVIPCPLGQGAQWRQGPDPRPRLQEECRRHPRKPGLQADRDAGKARRGLRCL
jgi:UDP-N-acetyl-D-glucosamine dehydrogenase